MKTLADHIIDLANNGASAAASEIRIFIRIHPDGKMECEIEDNGKGMSPGQTEACLHPFYTTRSTRHFGLGLPFIEQNSRAAGGELMVFSKPGSGTRVSFHWNLRHPDALPCGNLADCFVDLMSICEGVHFTLTTAVPGQTETWDSEELKAVLHPLSVRQAEVRKQLREWLNQTAKAFTQYWDCQHIEIEEFNKR